MQLYFIRHAQSTNNSLWAETGSNYGRSMDPGLSEIGYRQAHLLSGHLSETHANTGDLENDQQNKTGYIFTHLYTSLFLRAVETSMILSKTINIPPVAWADIHETGGVYLEDPISGERIGQEGLNREFFTTNYPDLVLPNDLGEMGWWGQPFEDTPLRIERAQLVLKDLIEKHGDSHDRVIFMSHGGFYNYLLMTMLNITERGDWWFLMNNTAISRFDFLNNQFVMVYQNRVDHLPYSLVT